MAWKDSCAIKSLSCWSIRALGILVGFVSDTQLAPIALDWYKPAP